MNTQDMTKSSDPLAEKLELLKQLLVEEDFEASPAGIARCSNSADSLPLSFAQQRLWFLAQLEPESAGYHLPMPLRLKGQLDAAALGQALNEIVRRHEVLRGTFAMADGQPIQRIVPTLEVSMPLVDLQALPQAQRECEALRLAAEDALQPFSLERGPLLRAGLVRLSEEDHVLLLNVHHIAFDGWSGGVLSHELAELYQAFRAGKPSPLPELPIQYADFAIWQRGWLQGAELERQLSYWEKQLAGVAALELPTDHARPILQSSRGAAETRLLPKALLEKLKVLGRRDGATLFMTLLAAFQTLLHRYTSQEDIACGSPIANRNRPEVEGLIGFFVNTLVLRTDFSGNPSFREILRRVRNLTLEAYAHQDLPFEKLVEVLQPQRDLSRNPIFQVLVALQNAPDASRPLAGLTAELFNAPLQATRFDLELHFAEQAEGLAVVLVYSVDLFEKATIERMVERFCRFLETLAANPDVPVADLSLLTEAERQQLVVEWNDTATAESGAVRCIHELFEAQVARTPQAVAVAWGGESLSYAALNRQADNLADRLRKLGVGPDVLVGICLERSVEMAVAVLAVLKAGGAYVPLDPAYPQERLGFMMQETQAPVVLTQRRFIERLPATGAHILCVEALLSAQQDLPIAGQAAPAERVRPHHLAYVIYTSGSTGQPKGVAMPHEALANLIAWQIGHCRQPAAARTLQFASLSFDVSFQEIFSTWCSGGTLVLTPDEVRRDSRELLEFIHSHAIERVFLPFVALQQLAETAERAPCLPRSLRDIVTAGEQLQVTPALVRFMERLDDCSLENQYGPTEAHVVSSFRLGGSPNAWQPLPPIGRPIANTQLLVLDSRRQPVPIGVPGELHIGGACLARGYLRRPELTAEKFVSHPFGSNGSGRLYRTGDLARLRPDGNIEFLGRKDDQLKIRGYRIELGEIEAVLRQHPAVKEAAVTTREESAGDKQLVAYVVLQPDQANALDELRGHLKRKVPDYMVPAFFEPLDNLPLTPSGKVDRRALPAPQRDARNGESHAAPRDELELQLCKIWEQVLGRQRIGVHDNFFEVGGHSLLAVKLISQIEKSVGTHLPLATLFQQPTVAELAAVLRQEGWAPPWSCLVPIQPGGARPPLFCVHGAGGNVFFLRDLARRLGADQPFYGIQCQGLKITDQPHDRVEDMAECYLAEIRRLQPQGPYFLAGFCMGGMVAYEMARRLQRDGQEVGLVALLESHGPGYFISPRNQIRFYYEERNFGQRIRDYFRQVRDATPSERKILVWRKAAQLRNRALAPAIQVLARILLWWGHPTLAALKRVHHANIEAQMHYLPHGVYPGRLDLFRAEKQPTGNYQYDPLYGWRACAGAVQVHEFPGYHGTLFQEPYVSVLADKLRQRLRAAQEANHHGS